MLCWEGGGGAVPFVEPLYYSCVGIEVVFVLAMESV